jgi:hypothetical protein
LTIDKSPEALRRLADQLHEPGSCPYCNRDPYHYVNNGVGQERVAVVCCEPGIELFQHGRETDEPKTLEYEVAATLRAWAERAAPAPAGDLVSVLVSTARPLVMPAGWADKELTAAFETALAIIRMAGKEVVDAAPAGDLVEVVARALAHQHFKLLAKTGDSLARDQGYVRRAVDDVWGDYTPEAEAALAAIRAAGREIVDAGTVERLTRERDELRLAILGGEDAPGYADTVLIADTIEMLHEGRRIDRARAEAAERERDEARAAATARHANPADWRYWEGRYRDEAADAARLREALKPFAQAWEVALKACSTSSLSDFGAVAKNHVEAIRFQRAHAALATKEPGDG